MQIMQSNTGITSTVFPHDVLEIVLTLGNNTVPPLHLKKQSLCLINMEKWKPMCHWIKQAIRFDCQDHRTNYEPQPHQAEEERKRQWVQTNACIKKKVGGGMGIQAFEISCDTILALCAAPPVMHSGSAASANILNTDYKLTATGSKDFAPV